MVGGLSSDTSMASKHGSHSAARGDGLRGVSDPSKRQHAKQEPLGVHPCTRAKELLVGCLPRIWFDPLPRLPPSHKAILLIRHGQADHNPTNGPSWLVNTVLFRDSALTPLGIGQAKAARQLLDQRNWTQHVESVLVSPLSRAIHTAHLVFQQVANLKLELRPMLTERAWFVCDRGSTPEVLVERHPFLAEPPWVGLSELGSQWWPDYIEYEEKLKLRVDDFRESLIECPERVIACVGHGAFFRTLLGVHLSNATPRWAELRGDASIVLRPEWDRLTWAQLAQHAGKLDASDTNATRTKIEAAGLL